MAAIQFVHAYSLLPETLPEHKRREFTTAGTNPVAFLKLFRGDSPRTLRTLVTAAACISFIEGKNTTDIFQVDASPPSLPLHRFPPSLPLHR
jgi:hypothetical protein